ncbi:MAG TPA: NAD-dependent malic enzyme, partial [Ktedonobacterales bacterium]|nr:NAD-dependent malic enzyme [Ktedonobacterales bacterium]
MVRSTQGMTQSEKGDDRSSGAPITHTGLFGKAVLEDPLLNKGSAFTREERMQLGLLGLLPPHIASMEDQLARTYENYQRKESDLERYIFLASLQDRNETLFFRLLQEHVAEMAPIIYTPTVGLACQQYSHIYRRPRGLYIAYLEQDEIEATLRRAPSAGVRVIVVTDGERILGLGDLGIGGMGIPVGKLALYTLCAGISPAVTLPIILDVGTDNEDLLADPLYLGWHHPRVRGAEYDQFLDAFVSAVARVFPHALLQWEDFARENARALLDRYRDRLCSFNDDIQGTGAVTLAGVLSAAHVTGARLQDQRVVLLGSGSAATGIADQIAAALRGADMDAAAAASTLWLVDSRGLVHDGRADLDDTKQRFAQPAARVAEWPRDGRGVISFDTVVERVRPTVLIGTAAQPGAFSQQMVTDLARHVERPVILPLSNPTNKSEAAPADLLRWTDGRALVATGSPFDPVNLGGHTFEIGQCNNMFIFPGVGLGVIISGAARVPDALFLAAATALSEMAPARSDSSGAL